jgi:hypothetical protein
VPDYDTNYGTIHVLGTGEGIESLRRIAAPLALRNAITAKWETDAALTLSEFDTKRCEKLVAQFIEGRRPPPHIRPELDLAFRINGQSVEIFEVRRHWRDESKFLEQPVAKATYNKSNEIGRFSGSELI